MYRIVTERGSSVPTDWKISSDIAISETSHVCLDIQKSKFISGSENSMRATLGDQFSLLSNDILKSDNLKYLILLNKSLFHVIQDTISVILKLHKIDPTAIFLLYSNGLSKDVDVDTLNIYFESLLDEAGITYVLIPTADDKYKKSFSKVVEIKNYIDIASYIEKNNLFLSLDDIQNTSTFIRDYAKTTDIEPYRKVYISRSHMESLPSRHFSPPVEYKGYTDDVRMKNEQVLEEYFKSKGYEILIPEKFFDTFKEQIQYMASVKVLASVSGSALINSLFMKDEQFILEIVAEVTQGGAFEYHQGIPIFYSNNSFIKRHTHLLVPSRRDPLEVIRLLDKSVELFNSLA